MKRNHVQLFTPDIPPDLEHAPQIREEALDWLETHYPGSHNFKTAEILKMVGETERRWLITRLRSYDIGKGTEYNLPEAADALTALFLRSKGVKFRDAVDAVIDRRETPGSHGTKYGGMWNRLVVNAIESMRRLITSRLLASVVFSLVRQREDHVNCLIIVKQVGKRISSRTVEQPVEVSHDYVYENILERPAPLCAVVAPSEEVMLFSPDQLPARSEITSRHFVMCNISTELDQYDLILGTMQPLDISKNRQTMEFIGRALDIVFHHFEVFIRSQSSSRLDTQIGPERSSARDIKLWLTTQLISTVYPGSICEISEISPSAHYTKVLASSVARPWEPSPWDPAKNLEMLSGYASVTGVPLIVENVEFPWTQIIEGVETELRYLTSQENNSKVTSHFSALALPITSSVGDTLGSIYILLPKLSKSRLNVEVLILSVFSRIIGEMIERHRSAICSAQVFTDVVNPKILKKEQFSEALLNLLEKQAGELNKDIYRQRDIRLPFLLLSVNSIESTQFDPETLQQLKIWLGETLKHLEWHSFIRSHLPEIREDWISDGFVGEVPGEGILIAFGSLVSKDELDLIRTAFPSTLNKTSPTNAPVELIAWILDIPSQRIVDASQQQNLSGLADEIENWAFNVATIVDDLGQAATLRDKGEWDQALRRVRQALQKPGATNNSYLRRLAADCSFALADWPGALRYAQEAVALSDQELGSGFVRSMCLEADAYLCLCQPIEAWELYSEAASKSPLHPLPRYYRGMALLLISRLLIAFEEESYSASNLDTKQVGKLKEISQVLIDISMADLTSAADLLERWGLIPETYQYRNFHLVPTLLGLGLGYLLAGSPGPAASRLQSARRLFPKDDIFFREFLFTKSCEQGIHRQYASLLLRDGWKPLYERIQKATK